MMPDLAYLGLWWLALQAIWLAALPLTVRLFRPFADGGAAFARPVGLVLVGYAIWLLGMLGLLRLTGATVLVGVAVLAVAAWSSPAQRAAALERLRRGSVLLWAGELVWVAGFLGLAWLRAYNPEIVNTEKPMDFLFLNALTRGEALPPEDPWLAGYPVSYYYFGYYLFALLGKLTGVPSNYSFNLALAALFGLLLSTAFSLGANLVALGRGAAAPGPAAEPPATVGRRGLAVYLLAGGLAALLVGLASNLEGLLEWLKRRGLATQELLDLFRVHDLTLAPEPFGSWWWWRASRVISDIHPVTGQRGETINEFPFFSYLLGDLHPHVMAAPFFLTVAALALRLLVEPAPVGRAWARAHRLEAGVGALLVGALGFLNAWDLPTGILLLAAARLVWGAQRGERGALVRAALFGLGLLAAALALYLPFYLGLRSQTIGLGIVEIRTRPAQFLLVWGLFMFLAWSLALVAAWRSGVFGGREEYPEQALHRVGSSGGGLLAGLPLGLGLIGAIVGLLAGATVLGGLLLLLGLLLSTALRPPAEPGRPEGTPGWSAALTFAGVATLLLALCEVVFAADVFNSRLNTVFKLYYQAWPLLACAGAYAVVYVVLVLGRSLAAPARYLLRPAWLAVFLALLAGSLAYTATAPNAKTGGFAGPPTLDGMRWLAQTYPDDAAALAWLRGNVRGMPVVLEAYQPRAYDYTGRVAAYTGLPTLLGWENHEAQWRGSLPVYGQRAADVDAIYRVDDPLVLRALLERYGVRYVFYGELERRRYGELDPERRQRFAQLLGIAYDNGGTTIFGPLAPGVASGGR